MFLLVLTSIWPQNCQYRCIVSNNVLAGATGSSVRARWGGRRCCSLASYDHALNCMQNNCLRSVMQDQATGETVPRLLDSHAHACDEAHIKRRGTVRQYWCPQIQRQRILLGVIDDIDIMWTPSTGRWGRKTRKSGNIRLRTKYYVLYVCTSDSGSITQWTGCITLTEVSG